jgi:hypothetical protein
MQAEAYYELGVMYHERVFESLDLAIAEYEKAVKAKPDYAEAHYNLALSYHTKPAGDEDKALYRKRAEYKLYLRYNPQGELANKAKQNIKVVEAKLREWWTGVGSMDGVRCARGWGGWSRRRFLLAVSGPVAMGGLPDRLPVSHLRRGRRCDDRPRVTRDPQAFRLLRTPDLQNYVAQVGQRVVAASDTRFNFQFKVVDHPSINAMALPGGFVYVTRGILAEMNDEAQLAGILGHEATHVNSRHGAKLMTKAMATIATLRSGRPPERQRGQLSGDDRQPPDELHASGVRAGVRAGGGRGRPALRPAGGVRSPAHGDHAPMDAPERYASRAAAVSRFRSDPPRYRHPDRQGRHHGDHASRREGAPGGPGE